jgi:hypothetical protein
MELFCYCPGERQPSNIVKCCCAAAKSRRGHHTCGENLFGFSRYD